MAKNNEVYNKLSNWTLETSGGISGSKGFWIFSAGTQRVGFEAQSIKRHEHLKVQLTATLSGFEIGLGVGKDLLEELAGISLEFLQPQFDEQPIYINYKNPAELKIADMLGPCILVSIDVGKVSAVKELAKYAGNTYLFLGQGKVVFDQAPDWLERMLKKLENGDTWGSYNKKFVEGHGIFSNARAICKVEINGMSPSAKAENKIGFFSGQITGSFPRRQTL